MYLLSYITSLPRLQQQNLSPTLGGSLVNLLICFLLILLYCWHGLPYLVIVIYILLIIRARRKVGLPASRYYSVAPCKSRQPFLDKKGSQSSPLFLSHLASLSLRLFFRRHGQRVQMNEPICRNRDEKRGIWVPNQRR